MSSVNNFFFHVRNQLLLILSFCYICFLIEAASVTNQITPGGSVNGEFLTAKNVSMS